MIEPLTRARPPVASASSDAPRAYLYGDVLDEIRFSGGFAPDGLAGGLLVGAPALCPDSAESYVEVTGFVGGVRAADILGLMRHFRSAWKSAAQALRFHFPKAELVGWFAAFPGAAPEPDQSALVLHQTFFNQPWQVGLWVAPAPASPVALTPEAGATGPSLRPGPVGVILPTRPR